MEEPFVRIFLMLSIGGASVVSAHWILDPLQIEGLVVDLILLLTAAVLGVLSDREIFRAVTRRLHVAKHHLGSSE
ncbi:MAG TPA: hypothetical protein VGO66_07045 [Solirubrobacterales bacterium]|jgi:hypothetical protein|nr:hypothetical protein [Solirubrobacterales bacterium]